MTEYNKVIYGGNTLIDLTSDDVTASDVRSGVYFHNAAGVRGAGTMPNVDGVYAVIGTQTASTNAWTGNIDVSALHDGLTIAYFLPYDGTSSSATLNLTLSGGGTTGAKNVYYKGTSRATTHYGKGSTVFLTYWSAGSISVDGTATTDDRWTSFDYNGDTIPSAQCTTSASTQAKTASLTYFAIQNNSYVQVNFRYANSYNGKITLNINSTGAKDIYINGKVSSSTNMTLPAGTYIAFYTDNKFYFTVGAIPVRDIAIYTTGSEDLDTLISDLNWSVDYVQP